MPFSGSAGNVAAAAYDGVAAAALASRLAVPALHLYATVGSTMDVAHTFAEHGAADGTVVLADRQTDGRGRAGRTWASSSGTGVWLTVVARPKDLRALEVLSLRVGLALAVALEPLAAGPVAVKWPNDLLVAGRKLAGILVEARWQANKPEWATVGVGVNVRPPHGFDGAAALRDDVTRVDALAAVIGAVRAAFAATGHLTTVEWEALGARDAVRGRTVLKPVHGRAAGIGVDGALVVDIGGGHLFLTRQANVLYAEDAPDRLLPE